MSHYDVLGVDPDAGPDTVREAYIRLARRHHPDVAGGDTDRMRAVNAAWQTLRDPSRRAQYDLALRGAQPSGATAPPRSPGTEPDPAYPYERFDADRSGFDWGDLEDDRPLGGTVVLPPWLRLVPVAMFGASVALVGTGVLFGAGSLLALGLLTFVLACLFFLAAPFLALLASRRSEVRHR